MGSPGDDESTRTCPQFYLCDPQVQEVYSDCRDYKRGALDIFMLPAAYLVYLREAENVQGEWDRAQREQLTAQAKLHAAAHPPNDGGQ